jgi:hypothetical protein
MFPAPWWPQASGLRGRLFWSKSMPRRVEEGVLVPAVAEPLLAWILPRSALVQERDFGGTCRSPPAGGFFLTTPPTP